MSKTKIFIFFVSLISINPLIARHLVGGEFTCQVVSSSDANAVYDIGFTMYRDCYQNDSNSPSILDTDFEYGIYKMKNDRWLYVASVQSQQNSGLQKLDTTCPTCIEYRNYTSRVTLPVIDSNYLIVFQRCCFGPNVSNIIDPGETGFSYVFEITPEIQNRVNQAPAFDILNNLSICADNLSKIDISCTDIEGDSLVYHFEAPFAGGGSIDGIGDCDTASPVESRCPPPFDKVKYVSNQLEENPLLSMSLDPTTGIISGSLDLVGHYLFGIRVEEYRDGELIGSYLRYAQVIVTICGEEEHEDCIEEEGITKIPTALERAVLNNSVLRFNTGSNPLTDAEVWVYDRFGKQIFHNQQYDNNFDANNYEAGVYYYVLLHENQVYKQTLTIF